MDKAYELRDDECIFTVRYILCWTDFAGTRAAKALHKMNLPE